jgi:4-hydroxybenzoate polyprenyltransferase
MMLASARELVPAASRLTTKPTTEMFNRLRHILEMIRFSHTLFALPFALLAAVMAWTTPTRTGERVPFRWQEIVGILLCMVLARSAAMAFNRLADRRIDAENPRTQNRHLPAGILSLQSVVVFTLVMCAGFVAATFLFFPNRLPLYLALPVLLFLLAYSFTKRFTVLAHFWLGTALMLAPVCAWIAIRGEVLSNDAFDITPAVFLGTAVMLWVSGFDIIYACQDHEFDVKARLRSVPAAIGIAQSLRVAALCHLGMVAALFAIPLVCPQVGFSFVYWVGITCVAALLSYEHWIVRPDDLTRVNIAFFNVNSIISFGLFVVGTVDLLI